MSNQNNLKNFISKFETNEDKKIILEKTMMYKKLLIEENSKINLISKTTIDDIDSRHLLDSLQIINLIKDREKTIADIGSGAGLPGVMLAIAGCKNINLIEKQRKKCLFLEKVNKDLGLKMIVHNDRVENIISKKFSYIVSRAFAKIDQILKLTKNLSDRNTIYLFMKGKTYIEEVKLINNKKFCVRFFNSITSRDSGIVELMSK